MQLNLSTWMMIFFILALVLSAWKLYMFLPNKPLADDDRTPEATKKLTNLMIKIIKEKRGEINEKELSDAIKSDQEFESKKFWRFNLNRLKHLLNEYYISNPNTNSIQGIYKKLV